MRGVTWRWIWLFICLLVISPPLQEAFCRNIGEIGLSRYLYGHDERGLPSAIRWLRFAFDRSHQSNVDLGLRLGLAYLYNHQSGEGVAILASVYDGLSSKPRWSWHSPASRWQMVVIGVPDYEWVKYLQRQTSPELALVEAFQAAQRGDYGTSLIRYHTALAMMPKAWSDLELMDYYQVLAHSTSPSDPVVSEILDQLNTTSGSDLKLEHVPASLSTPVSVTIGSTGGVNDWEPVNLTYDRHALELGPLVPSQLVWGSKGSRSTTLVQSVWLSNLVPNGGFEWPIPESPRFILGWETTTDQDNLAGRFLTVYDTLDGITHVAHLSQHSTSYASLMVPVDPHQSYLLAFQSGVRQQVASDPPVTVDARVMWLDSRYTLMQVPPLVRETMSGGWRNWAVVVRPPQQARWAQVLLSLHLMQPGQGERELDYDNVLFAVLPPAPNAGQ